ncbi:MAG TPA: aldo/keto reductase [Thermoanaerobacterales bacterium]|nr:aldo/keto reductase [Thermoanaerobacterales bacterium]
MKYNILGNTGMKVSRVGFGGIPIQHLNQDKATEVINKAIEMDINFFDTARAYTNSESLFGIALKDYRKDIYIATKSLVRDKEGMLAEVEISLKELQTDYIDLYQIHNVGSEEEYEKIIGEDGAYEALKQLEAEGVIKHIGITSHKAEIMEKAIESDLFETVQFPFNVLETEAAEIFKKATDKNLGTIAMKPLAGGALRNGRDAIKFLLESPYLDVAIPGMDTVEQVIENATAANDVSLTDKERQELLATAKELGQSFCRRCGYCLPCSEGINIPYMFLVEAYYTRYDLKDWATQRYLTQDKTAGDCIKCGICETRCPYELPIMEMMEQVESIFE